MKDHLAQKYLQDMQERGLFDSAEFLFKSGVISQNTVVISERKAALSRALNLLCMREYYQVSQLLSSCPCALKAPENAYVYCSCCLDKENFLRNYARYLLAAIKQEPLSDVIIGSERVSSSQVNEAIRSSLRMKGCRKTVFDSEVFDDPYLVYMLVMSKREELHPRVLQKTLLYIISQVPYFWEPYRILSEICVPSSIDVCVKEVPELDMKDLFKLYIGSKKSVMFPEFRKLFTEPYKALHCQKTPFADSMIASVLAHYKQFKQAGEMFEVIVSESFGRDNLEQYANTLYSVRNIEKLSSLLVTVYDRYYNLPLYHYVAGNLLSITGRHTESIEEYQKLLRETHPGEFDIAYVFVAQEFYLLKDMCSAIKACNLAIKKNYNDYRVWSNMAQIYFTIDMCEYALHFFRKSVEISPDTPGVYESLGMCFEKLAKHDNAIKCYEKGYRKGSIKSLSLLGNLLHYLKTPEYRKHLEEYLKLCLFGVPAHKWFIDANEISLEEAEKYIEVLAPTTDAGTLSIWKARLEDLKAQKR
ncbi:anaphase-promoting complex subunit 8 [Nematocida sp. AWRm77]|nr:anaphase-promoting complex subunit 8 [Nematocida sp. AWRm77]